MSGSLPPKAGKEVAVKAKRERGEGSIYQRGKAWWIKYSVRGKVYRESSRSDKPGHATRLLRRRLSEIQSGRHAPDAERVEFEDLVKLVENDYRLNSNRSWLRAARSFARLRKAFGDVRAVDITADRVTKYVAARMDEGAAQATISNELAALKRGFALAIRAGRLHGKPAFPMIRLDNARKGFFEEDDFRALVAELPPYLRSPIIFAYLTGWRITDEVLSLRWEQVDLHAGIVRREVGTTKNRDGREWPIHALPELARLLQSLRDESKAAGHITPFVFNRHGKPIKDFRGAWSSACERAAYREENGTRVLVRPGLVARLEIDPATGKAKRVRPIPHDFRRTAVRNLERAGVSRSVAMKLVGHKTESIYRRYAIVSARDLAEGVAKLANLHDGHKTGTKDETDAGASVSMEQPQLAAM
ncbi:MAG TPA: tyrosine-type recombinase/integrase [Gemmatimonadaceae bacterium]|nr:tyrosine-type recombinase/integrase [Gemmatimonadaceae bacterium]